MDARPLTKPPTHSALHAEGGPYVSAHSAEVPFGNSSVPARVAGAVVDAGRVTPLGSRRRKMNGRETTLPKWSRQRTTIDGRMWNSDETSGHSERGHLLRVVPMGDQRIDDHDPHTHIGQRPDRVVGHPPDRADGSEGGEDDADPDSDL
jgi:hypothetical protein